MKSLVTRSRAVFFALMIAAGADTNAALAQSVAQERVTEAAGSPSARDVQPGASSQEPLPTLFKSSSDASPSSSNVAPALPAEASPSMPANTNPSVSTKTLPHDLSPWGMFMQADIVVKIVMIGLAFASLATWTVWLAKAFELGRAKRRLRRGISKILSAATLDEAAASLETVNDTSAVLMREAADELRVSAPMLDHADRSGINERVTSRLSRVETEAGQRMTKGTGLLATIGATAPFVGLFGTVWGIMNSFIGISQSQTTNLAVVAPGIAEALLATALGLVAAIPAVIIYNVFARSITGYRRLLGDASAGIERLVSRQLDFRCVA